MSTSERVGLICRRNETQGIASAAHATCHDATVAATLSIDTIPQVFEDDAIAILHALEGAIRRSGNTHCAHWKGLADELAAWQIHLNDVDERQNYEWESK